MGLANIVECHQPVTAMNLRSAGISKPAVKASFCGLTATGVRQAVTILIPHNFFNLLCFFSVSQISAFFNKLLLRFIVNGLMDN